MSSIQICSVCNKDWEMFKRIEKKRKEKRREKLTLLGKCERMRKRQKKKSQISSIEIP